MCTPTAMFVTTLLITAAQAKIASDQSKFEAGVNRYNARVAENTAQQVRNVGLEKENIQRQKTMQLLSKQKAQLGAAGVSLESGTPLQLQEDTITLGEADALRIRSTTDAQVKSLMTQAELSESQAEFSASAGEKRVAGTLLKGAASIAGSGVADKWFTPDSAAMTGPGAGALGGVGR